MRVHESWQKFIDEALASLDRKYFNFLLHDKNFFPSRKNFLNAFTTLPKYKTKAILFGQDPYPREQSACGYAFIDAKVAKIFSENGFSKQVNKATSLRNFLKMQLRAERFLGKDTSQEAIAKIPKKALINSIYDLRDNFQKEGILLLNRSLVFTDKKDSKSHIKAFTPFVKSLLNSLKKDKLDLILFGNDAKDIEKLLPSFHEFKFLKTPHPYKLSFIDDVNAMRYFAKLKLISKPLV